MNGSARVVTPTEIGAMMNTRVFIEVRVSLSDSSRFPSAADLEKYGNRRLVATNENSPTMMM